MNWYTIKFQGRKAGAIGAYSIFIETVKAFSEDAARNELYRLGYEHIHVRSINKHE